MILPVHDLGKISVLERMLIRRVAVTNKFTMDSGNIKEKKNADSKQLCVVIDRISQYTKILLIR